MTRSQETEKRKNCAQALKCLIMQISKEETFHHISFLRSSQTFFHQNFIRSSLETLAITRIGCYCTSKHSFRADDTRCHHPKCCPCLGRMRISYETHWRVFDVKHCTSGNCVWRERRGASMVLMLLPFCPARSAQISRMLLHAASPIFKTQEAGHSN